MRIGVFGEITRCELQRPFQACGANTLDYRAVKSVLLETARQVSAISSAA
jgi:hypothetical protein